MGVDVHRRKRMGVAIGAMLLVPLMAGCSDDEDEGASASLACEADGTTERQEAGPEPSSSFVITDVRQETVQGGCERLIFDLEPSDGDTALAYGVSYREGPLPGPSGPIEVDGHSILEVVLRESSADSGVGPPDLGGDSDLFVEAVQLPEVPGGAIWAFGVVERRPFTVTVEGSSTVQLIVTFAPSSDG